MSEIYLRPVNPKCECKDCSFITGITIKDTGKKYCSFLDIFVEPDSLCPEFHRRK